MRHLCLALKESCLSDFARSDYVHEPDAVDVDGDDHSLTQLSQGMSRYY